MNNVFTNSINFKFSSVPTFSYSGKPKYAAGKLEYDNNGNARFNCNSYSYCDYRELWSWLLDNFDDEYFYRNVKISFYGKNTRTVKAGRSYIYVSAEDKIDIAGEYFIPDLMLALYLVNTYDILRPYGFNKTYVFRNKTNTEIADYFEIKFASYAGTFKLPCDTNTKAELIDQWESYCNLTRDILCDQFNCDIFRVESYSVADSLKELPAPLAYIDQYSDFINEAIKEFNNNDDWCRVKGKDPETFFTKKEVWSTTKCTLQNGKTYCIRFNDEHYYVHCENVGLKPVFENCKLKTGTFAGKLGAIFMDENGERYLYEVHPDDYKFVKVFDLKKSNEDHIYRGKVEGHCTLSTFLLCLEKGTTKLYEW